MFEWDQKESFVNTKDMQVFKSERLLPIEIAESTCRVFQIVRKPSSKLIRKDGRKTTIGIEYSRHSYEKYTKRALKAKGFKVKWNRSCITRVGLKYRGTPDAFLEKTTTGKNKKRFIIPVEIKCSKNFKTKERLNSYLAEPTCFLTRDLDGMLTVKKNSSAYYQVQAYAALCGASYGYLAIAISDEVLLLKIEADSLAQAELAKRAETAIQLLNLERDVAGSSLCRVLVERSEVGACQWVPKVTDRAASLGTDKPGLGGAPNESTATLKL